MGIHITATDPRDPGVVALLEQSHALMRRLFTPDQNNFLDIDALCDPLITMFLARDTTAALGCVALRRMDGYGEVKSFFVDPAARGRGVGRALLEHLEQTASRERLPCLRLETGVGLDAAMHLYVAQGYSACGPFADYVDNGASLFFGKSLHQPR